MNCPRYGSKISNVSYHRTGKWFGVCQLIERIHQVSNIRGVASPFPAAPVSPAVSAPGMLHTIKVPILTTP